MCQDKSYNHYLNMYNLCDNEIMDLISARKLYICLYNDSILEDEKKYYKGKIDCLDGKLDLMCLSQNLIFKHLLNEHKTIT